MRRLRTPYTGSAGTTRAALQVKGPREARRRRDPFRVPGVFLRGASQAEGREFEPRRPLLKKVSISREIVKLCGLVTLGFLTPAPAPPPVCPSVCRRTSA
jgi:hypothetical protein